MPGAEMTDSRTLDLWGQVAAHAAADGRRVSVADVCAVAVSSAQLAGAWLAAARGADPDFLMCVTGQVGEQLSELQLTLGEGPCHDVLVSAAPVLAADLGDAESARRWPGFAPAARQLGAGAVFAFPLIVGAIRAGVLGLYRGSAGPLPDRQLGDLLILADVATVMLLDSTHGDAETENGSRLDGQARDLALHRAEIDQATGMLTVQLDVSAAEAFARLRAYAYSQNRRLADVAGDIVARRLRLPRDQDPGRDP
jgi:ANTAR domain/GAF domain